MGSPVCGVIDIHGSDVGGLVCISYEHLRYPVLCSDL